MRSGQTSTLAALTGVLLLTGGCAQGASVAMGGTAPAMTETAPGAAATGQAPAVEHQTRPTAQDPVRVPPPKLSEHRYVFPVRGCATVYQRQLVALPKTTIWAAKGCAFVAPVSGVVDEVNARNRWLPSVDSGPTREGRFVSVLGDDGVRYLGGHLDTVRNGVRPGLRVRAGQQLGTVGHSGNARDTAANLYFAISWKTGPALWWVRRGMVNPWNYLDAWRTGNATLSPRAETFALRARVGETPPCAVLCAAKPPKRQPARPTLEQEPERERDGLLPRGEDGTPSIFG